MRCKVVRLVIDGTPSLLERSVHDCFFISLWVRGAHRVGVLRHCGPFRSCCDRRQVPVNMSSGQRVQHIRM